MRDVELLIPASNLEVLKVAVLYGADAVYIGGRCMDYVPKQRISPWKMLKKELNLHINTE